MSISRKYKRSFLRLTHLTTAGLIAAGCARGPTDTDPATSLETTSQALEGTPVTLEFPFPAGKQPQQFAVVGIAGVDLEDRSRVLRAEGYGAVANTSTGRITVGADAHSGSLLAKGDVFLRDRATVHGKLTFGGNRIVQNSWTVEGEQTTAPLTTASLRFTAKVPTSALPLVRLEPNDVRPNPLPPGRYEGLDLKQNASLVLRAGEYVFDSFNLEPGAKLKIDDSGGRVQVFVRNSLTVKSAAERVGGGFPNLLFVFAGSGDATITAPFAGWLIAPSAHINLETIGNGAVHEGAFFGKLVRLAPDTKILQRSFPWLIQTIDIEPKQVCAGQSTTIDVVAKDPSGGDAPVTVLIDRVPVTSYTDQFFGIPGPRELTVVAKSADGWLESQIATVDVVESSGQEQPPRLVIEENLLEQDSAHITVLNAADYEDGTERYVYDFGDGQTLVSKRPSVTHDFTHALGLDEEYKAFVVRVTVKRSGLPDVTAARSVVIWNTYAITKSRGSIEPPTKPVSVELSRSAGIWQGALRVTNREPTALALTGLRLDVVPCNGDQRARVGALEPLSLSIAPGATQRVHVELPVASVTNADCGVTAHLFGNLADGTKAQSSAYFEISNANEEVPVSPEQAALLEYVIEQGLVSNPDLITGEELTALYRQRRLRYSVANQSFYQSVPAPGEECDADAPGTPPQPGYACLPTNRFKSTPESYIANGYKGDAVLIHACGFVTDMFQKLDPPQKYSHSGMMIKNRTELRHSTGQDSWLMAHPVGIGGLPTDGIEEDALRYFWPGPISATVEEAFESGKKALSPEGDEYSVTGFNRHSARCPGDASIIFPRLLKPAPEHEASVRPTLENAAEQAKVLNGHYRFAVYSDATLIGSDDPNAPGWGPQPTVCSAFVRQSLVNAGVTVDGNKLLPLPSSVAADTPDGMYVYTEAERLAAAEALAAWLRNQAHGKFTELNDQYWWASLAGGSVAGGVVGLLLGGPLGGLIGAAAGAAGGGALGEFIGLGDQAQAYLDTPDKIANQFTNCFASDFCAIEANQSLAWREPGTGVALSPDDLMNHFDAPEQGGVYGYHEPLVYRTKRFRRVYEWQPAEGSRALRGRVESLGEVVSAARIEIASLDTVTQTDTLGRFTVEAVPSGTVSIHASKTIDGVLREAEGCFEPSGDVLWQPVDCSTFEPIDGARPVAEVLLELDGPDPRFRRVTITGRVSVDDCDCIPPFWTHHDVEPGPIHGVCDVGPGETEALINFTEQRFCSDEVRAQVAGVCLYLPNGSVQVFIDARFYNSANNNGSCGGNNLTVSQTYSTLVPPNATRSIYSPPLVDNGLCWNIFPYECSNRATFSQLEAKNDIAP